MCMYHINLDSKDKLVTFVKAIILKGYYKESSFF